MKSINLLVILTGLLARASGAPLAAGARANDKMPEIETPVYIPSGNRMVVTRDEDEIETPVYIPSGNRMVVTRDVDDIETPVYIPSGNRMVVTRDEDLSG